MLLREHSSCLCRGENGKSFCLAELWPALIVRIHWDFTINAVHAFQNTKKNYFGFTHAPLKFISAPRKNKLMTADDSIKCRCANSGMTGRQFSKSSGLSASVSLSLPHPLPALLLASFFARSLTLVPHSLLLVNRTETLATQARPVKKNQRLNGVLT